MSIFSQLCEDILGAVDQKGAKGCYSKSVKKYAKIFGLPEAGLWAVVDAVLENQDREKALKRIQKAYGGPPQIWLKWWELAKIKPDCNVD